MASSDNEVLRLIDKFNGENFSLWKFKMKIILAWRALWGILDELEVAPPFATTLKDKKV